MSTAANGAQEFYIKSENENEMLDAISLDKKIQEAWVRHSNFVLINNWYDEFQDKIEEVCERAFAFLGLPSNVWF